VRNAAFVVVVALVTVLFVGLVYVVRSQVPVSTVLASPTPTATSDRVAEPDVDHAGADGRRGAPRRSARSSSAERSARQATFRLVRGPARTLLLRRRVT